MLDLLLVLSYFIAIVLIGIWCGRGEHNLDDFALGRRQIPWWAVFTSIIASETTAATYLGLPTEAYVFGNLTLMQMAFGMILGRILVGNYFLKAYYRYQVYSIYEFLEIRFGKKTRSLASLLFLSTRILASGTRLYVEAILLVVLMRVILGRSLSINEEVLLYCGTIIFLTTLTTIYTFWGGIKAVIWTDLVQTCLMVVSLLFCFGLLLYKIPSAYRPDLWTISWFDSGIKSGQFLIESLHHILASPYTIWSAVIAQTFLTMATHGTDQDMVQRMLTAKNLRQSRRSIVLSGLAEVPILFGFLSIGLLLHSYFQMQPADIPAKSNEIFPYFIVTQLPPGLRGLLIVGLFATTMGSLSSALNALATAFTRDWSRLVFKNASDLQIARYATLVFALILVLVACLTATVVVLDPSLRIIPLVIGIFGYTYGSLLGIFLLGLSTSQRGTDTGNLVAMVAGIIGVLTIGGIPGFFSGLIELAFPWRIVVGTLISYSLAWCLSKSASM